VLSKKKEKRKNQARTEDPHVGQVRKRPHTEANLETRFPQPLSALSTKENGKKEGKKKKKEKHQARNEDHGSVFGKRDVERVLAAAHHVFVVSRG